MKILKHCLLLGALFVAPSFVVAPAALAQESSARSVYDLNDYVVTMPRNTQLSKLREQAIRKATREGLGSVLKSLTPRYTWRRHDLLLSSVNWNTVVSRLSVKSEVSENADGLYELTANITYNRDVLRDLLTKNNVPYSEDLGGRVLVVPVLDDGRLKLWESSNIWRDAIKGALASQRAFEFILPVGDIDEVGMLSPQLALDGAQDALFKLAGNYDADAVVVVRAKVEDMTFTKQLSVQSQWYESDYVTPPITITSKLTDDAPLNQALASAAVDALSMISEQKRSEALVDVNMEDKVLLRYKPQSAADLESMRNKVRSLNTVKDLKLRVMNVRDSVFQVSFYGDRVKLQRQLEGAGLIVEETNMDSVWQVRLKDNAIMGDF